MSNFIVINGDRVQFMPLFEDSMVAVQPGTITGSGHATLSGKKVCVTSDITSVNVTNVSYVSPQYPVAGLGTLKIKNLNGDQQKQWCESNGKVIVVGTMFTATFDVTSPAKAASPLNGSDTNLQKTGSGSFINSQIFVTASEG